MSDRIDCVAEPMERTTILIPRSRPSGVPRWVGVDDVVVPMGAPVVGAATVWFGAVSSRTVLSLAEGAGEFERPREYGGCGRLICDAGSLAGESEVEASFANWGPRARPALDAACGALGSVLVRAGVTLCVRPSAGQVLSDVPSCLGFLRTHGGGPFGLYLEPGALLDESMLGRAEEHFDRMLGALLEQPGLVAVVIANVARGERGLTSVPVHEGVLEPGLLVMVAGRAMAAGRPIVVHRREDRVREIVPTA